MPVLAVHPMLLRLVVVAVWCLISAILLSLAVKLVGRSRHPLDYPRALAVCFLAVCAATLIFFIPMFFMFAAGFVDRDAPDLIYLAAYFAVPAILFLATTVFTADKARIPFSRALTVTVVYFVFSLPLAAVLWLVSRQLGFQIIGFEG
jgi:hypothetical protein